MVNLQSADSRREFLKKAVALGGVTALAACVERRDVESPTGGGEGAPERPDGQHEWGEFSSTDEYGNANPPKHHVLRFLSLPGDGTPTAEDREVLESALTTLEEAYSWSNTGLFFTVGYSSAYFDRFGVEESPIAEPVPLAEFEDPELEEYDIAIHFASDHPEALLEAEQAMLDEERDTVNDVEVTDRISDVVAEPSTEYPDRRTGFVGEGLPKKFVSELDEELGDKIPEEAPLMMGFESVLDGNQATEGRITISDGRFSGGSTMQVSALSIDMEQWWYQDDRWQRIAKMFSPAHAEEEMVEGVGNNLSEDVDPEDSEDPVETARTTGVVGHAQKMKDAREDGEPLILRRDFDTIDQDDTGVHFVSHQASIDAFVKTRTKMNGADVAAESSVGARTNNGILQYLETGRRGNYLLPPQSLRAFPEP